MSSLSLYVLLSELSEGFLATLASKIFSVSFWNLTAREGIKALNAKAAKKSSLSSLRRKPTVVIARLF